MVDISSDDVQPRWTDAAVEITDAEIVDELGVDGAIETVVDGDVSPLPADAQQAILDHLRGELAPNVDVVATERRENDAADVPFYYDPASFRVYVDPEFDGDESVVADSPTEATWHALGLAQYLSTLSDETAGAVYHAGLRSFERETATAVSALAAVSPAMFVAESYVLLATDGELPPDARALYDKYRGPEVVDG